MKNYGMLLMDYFNGQADVQQFKKGRREVDIYTSFLKEDGQILLNSVDFKRSQAEDDIKYMQMNEASGRYYGEVRYRTIYNDAEGEMFNWLYLDFDTLKDYVARVGLDCETLKTDETGNYLARLKKKMDI